MFTVSHGSIPCQGQLYLFSELQPGEKTPPERITKSSRLVLRYFQDLACHYGPDHIFPAVKTIAKRTDISERSVQRSIRQLAYLQMIEIVEDLTVRTQRRFLLKDKCHPKAIPRQIVAQGARQIVTQSSSPSETQKEIKSVTTTTLSHPVEEPSQEELDWVVADMKPKNPVTYRKSLVKKGIHLDLRVKYRKHLQKQADAWKAQERKAMLSPVIAVPVIEEDMSAVFERAAGDPKDPLHGYALDYLRRKNQIRPDSRSLTL